jgi:hypothetical protein
VKKRLGVGNFAFIKSLGKIKIGSCFSNMANLPEKQPLSNDMSLVTFNEAVNEAVNKKERTTLFHAGSDVMIDNMQGVATISTNKEC